MKKSNVEGIKDERPTSNFQRPMKEETNIQRTTSKPPFLRPGVPHLDDLSTNVVDLKIGKVVNS
ncbi:MAG: hypothetical protein C4576_15255 [Desulfobacteraceae bacterium]|nr:MAG: hypothetical protein C4576_15255 [Desulfobacteraceae bacterium]